MARMSRWPDQQPHTARQVGAAGIEGLPLADQIHQHIGQIDRMPHQVIEMLQPALGFDTGVTFSGGPFTELVHHRQQAEGILFERRVFHSVFATEDQKEGMSAFIDKRKPSFKNR